jgi:molybdopterin/thiamine biosynthesis adenylyltransferase
MQWARVARRPPGEPATASNAAHSYQAAGCTVRRGAGRRQLAKTEEDELTTSGAAEPDRYSRQSRFWRIGRTGQERIGAGRVLVIGCGALGSAAVDLLARAGVGHIAIVDRDFVELSNLHRQLLFDEADAAAGTPKAIAAAHAVARINSEVEVRPFVADVTSANVEQFVAQADVVLDGTDNLETRYLVNDACMKLGIPWVYGGAIGSTGMSMTILPGETACFRCLFPIPQPAGSMETCEVSGVLAGGVVTVAAIEWAEVMKLLVGDRENLRHGLTALDVWTNDYLEPEGRPRDPECPCCGMRRFEYLDALATSRTASLCGRDAVQVSPGQPMALDLVDLGRRLEATGPVTSNEYLVRCLVDGHEMTIFADGRAIIKGTPDLSVARSLYARYVGT